MSLKTIINGIDVGRQRAAASAGSSPVRAGVTTSTEWLGGTQTRTVVSPTRHRGGPGRDFTIDADYPDALLGSGVAPSPHELLMAALGASFVTSFVLAASAADVRIEYLRMRTEARIGSDAPMAGVQGEPTPLACQLAIEVHANASTAVLERISALAVKDCSVLALFRVNIHIQMLVEGNGLSEHIARPHVRNKQQNGGRSET